jgi:hypothetical protein
MTIVVMALIGGSALERTVAAACATGAEVLVSHRDGRIADPDGRTLGVSGQASVPMRRQAAAERACGDYVAFLEDTVLPGEGWLPALEAAFRHPDVAAVGGPVDIARHLPPRCRALAWTEYGRFQGGGGDALAPIGALPGCNFAFRTAALNAMLGNATGGLIDQEIFAAIRASGRQIMFARDMRTTYAAAHPEGVRLRGRFAHGRIYAARSRGRGAQRLAAALKAFAVPSVLLVRQLGQMRRAGPIDPAALSWMAAMDGAWGAGELTGALFGPGRNGLADWN